MYLYMYIRIRTHTHKHVNVCINTCQTEGDEYERVNKDQFESGLKKRNDERGKREKGKKVVK